MRTILAIELGKSNSVFCVFDESTGEASFRMAKTPPATLRTELSRQPEIRNAPVIRSRTC